MKRLSIFDSSRCTGCKLCEIICSFTHEGECRPASARLKVHREPFTGETIIKINDNCDLCNGKTECVRWCPAGVFKYRKGELGNG